MRKTTRSMLRATVLLAVVADSGAGQAPVEQVKLPGYTAPIPGRWLGAAQADSGVPLGGLGTGFLEIRPDGRIHDTCVRNNWLKPVSPLLFRLTATLGAGAKARTVVLLSGKGDVSKPEIARFLGHYPAADLVYAEPSTSPVVIHVRAFSPFVPPDPDLSNIPAAVFSVRVTNRGSAPLAVRVGLQLAEPGMDGSTATQFKSKDAAGMQCSLGAGAGVALLAGGGESPSTADSPTSEYGDPSLRVFTSGPIKPGEERVVTFILGWYSPRWNTSDGKAVRNRYAARFADARGVATFVADRSAAIEQKVISWQQEVYARPIPDWLKDGLINSLYALCRNSIWLDDGRLLVNESFTGRPVTEAVACRFNSSYPLLQLFPEQEIHAIRALAKQQAQNGEIPFGLGAPLGIESPLFGAQRPLLSTEFVLMCWRDFVWTEDLEFLVGIYPRLKRALQYAMTLDRDNDGLINESPGSDTGFPSNQYYDSWPWFGTSSFTAGIGLAALRAGEEAAKRCGDEEFAAWCRERHDRGRAAFDELLWNGRHYRLYSDPEGFRQSDTCLADQLCGQMIAWLAGLGDILPFEHVQSALREVDRLNTRSKPGGIVSAAKPDGSADASGGPQSSDVVLAESINYAAAALMLAARRSDDDLRKNVTAAIERSLDLLAGQGRTWDQPFILGSNDGSPVNGRHYTGNLALWELPYGLMGIEMRRAVLEKR